MTSSYRPRGSSPPGYRRFTDPRASTGAVFASSFEPRSYQHPRSSLDTFATPRGGERPYEAQPIAQRVYPDQGYSGATKSRTEYALRPVKNTATEEERRRPSSLTIPPSSPIRSRPLINNDASRERSPLPKPRTQDESERYIYPAATPTSHRSGPIHQRQYSALPVDTSSLRIPDRERRERGGYRSSGMGASRGYPTSGPLVRTHDDDYSYTGPREQFDRDYPPPRPRRDAYTRKERPNSAINFVDLRPPALSRRDQGPPPAAIRQLERIEKPPGYPPTSRGGAGSDNERDIDIPRRRHTLRAPVSLHQDRELVRPSPRDEHDDRRDHRSRRDRQDDDDVYSSDRDNRDHHSASHHHDRHHQPYREISPEKKGHSHGLAAAGLGAAAAAGVAGALVKGSRESEPPEDQDLRRERRSRRRRDHGDREQDIQEEDEPVSERDRERDRDRFFDQDGRPTGHPRQRSSVKDRNDGDSVDEDGLHRHHRRRHHDEDNSRAETDSSSGSEVKAVSERPKERRREELVERFEDDDSDRKHRDRQRLRDEVRDRSTESYTRAPGEDEDDRPRRVQLVEPPKEKEPEVKPRGILKPARTTPFPEDPNPTREGVAPLKDAGKKGIPTNARWTKINRMLVNPAALEASHERFEERDDYVIVLRVLTREEIEKFAIKTREIRGIHSLCD